MSQATVWINKVTICANNVLHSNNLMHSVDVDPELSWVVRALATYRALDSHRGVDSMKLAIVLPCILNIRIVLVASETLGRTIRKVGDFVVLAGHLGVLDGAWRRYRPHQHFGGQLFHPCKATKL